MINGHDGGRRPSFLGLWTGRLIGVVCLGYLALVALKAVGHG